MKEIATDSEIDIESMHLPGMKGKKVFLMSSWLTKFDGNRSSGTVRFDGFVEGMVALFSVEVT